MLKLLAGTSNPHKVEEIAAILGDFPSGRTIEILKSDRLPRQPEVRENGATFEANAEIKARAFAGAASQLPADHRPDWVLADDSGLCVDALNGAPGVHSARYASSPDSPGNSGTAANNRKLLDALKGIPPERRQAHFVCALAVAAVPPRAGEPARILFTARGECHGAILTEERGSGGFGYDPLFFFPERGLTFAELTPGEKNRVSHRSLALRQLREKIISAEGAGLDPGQDLPRT